MRRLACLAAVLVYLTMTSCLTVKITTPAGESAGPGYYDLSWVAYSGVAPRPLRGVLNSDLEYRGCDITTAPTPVPGTKSQQPPAGQVEWIGTPNNPFVLQPIRSKFPVTYTQGGSSAVCGPGDTTLGYASQTLPLVGYRAPAGFDPGFFRKCLAGNNARSSATGGEVGFAGFFDVTYCPEKLGPHRPVGFWGYNSNTEAPNGSDNGPTYDDCHNDAGEDVDFVQCRVDSGMLRSGNDCQFWRHGVYAGAPYAPGASMSSASSPYRFVWEQRPPTEGGGRYDVTIGTDYVAAGRCNSGRCTQPCGDQKTWFDFSSFGTTNNLGSLGGAAAWPGASDMRWRFKARVALRRTTGTAITPYNPTGEAASADAFLSVSGWVNGVRSGLQLNFPPDNDPARQANDGPWHQQVCDCCRGLGPCGGDRACVGGERFECAIQSVRDTGGYDGRTIYVDLGALGYPALANHFQEYNINMTEIWQLLAIARRRDPTTQLVYDVAEGMTSPTQIGSYALSWGVETSSAASYLIQIRDYYLSTLNPGPLPTPVRTATPVPTPTPSPTPTRTPTPTPTGTPTPTPSPTPTASPPPSPTPIGVTPTPVRSTPTPTPIPPPTPTPTPTRTPVPTATPAGTTPTPAPTPDPGATGGPLVGSWFPHFGGTLLPGESSYASFPLGASFATGGGEEFWYCSPDQTTDADVRTAYLAAKAAGRDPGCFVAEPSPGFWCYDLTRPAGGNVWNVLNGVRTLKPGTEMPETLYTGGATAAQVVARVRMLADLGMPPNKIMVAPVPYMVRNRLTSQLPDYFNDVVYAVPTGSRAEFQRRASTKTWPAGAAERTAGMFLDDPDTVTVDVDAACLGFYLHALKAQHPEVGRAVVQLANSGGGYGWHGHGLDAGRKFGDKLAEAGFRREIQIESAHYDLVPPGTPDPFAIPATLDCPFYLASKAGGNVVSIFTTHGYTQLRDAMRACN